jgi:ParB/RepB/Spo0J family partition protein
MILHLKEFGLIEPIVVTKNGKSQYSVIAGNRRLRACKAIELKEIPAIVSPPISNAEERVYTTGQNADFISRQRLQL